MRALPVVTDYPRAGMYQWASDNLSPSLRVHSFYYVNDDVGTRGLSSPVFLAVGTPALPDVMEPVFLELERRGMEMIPAAALAHRFRQIPLCDDAPYIAAYLWRAEQQAGAYMAEALGRPVTEVGSSLERSMNELLLQEPYEWRPRGFEGWEVRCQEPGCLELVPRWSRGRW